MGWRNFAVGLVLGVRVVSVWVERADQADKGGEQGYG